MAAGARLLPRARIRRPAEFKQVFAEGIRIGGGSTRAPLGLACRPNGLDHPRLGLAIARKAVATATGRNRVKRLVREEFRQHQNELPAVDLVFYGHAGLARADAAQIRQTLAEFWLKVIDRCGGC